MPPKSRKKRLSDEWERIAREEKKARVDKPVLEQRSAVAANPGASAETTATTPPVVDPEESDLSDDTLDPE